jgi:hypothetical protein
MKFSALLLLLVGCTGLESGSVVVPYDRVTHELVAVLSPDDQAVATDHGGLMLDCTFRNVSKRPVQINSFILNASSWILKIIGPDGKVLPTVPLAYYSREQLQKHVRVLQPGDSYRVRYSDILVSYMCDMPAGRYQVEVEGIRSQPVCFTLLHDRKF